MSEYNVAPLENLVDKFEMLPGIGRKTAQRLAYFVLNLPEDKAKSFSDAILEAHSKIKYCKICKNITDDEICSICKNPLNEACITCQSNQESNEAKDCRKVVGICNHCFHTHCIILKKYQYFL